MINQEIGDCKILEELGSGGMGIVYKAMDLSLNRIVAIKMLNPDLARDQDLMDRFKKEARALAQLHSPNIVSIFSFNKSDIGSYIVMEYVDGVTLAKMVAENGPLDYTYTLSILKQVLVAMSHAHKVGVIHRDIKPANIMLNSKNVVKITDFGLAKLQLNLDSSTNMTTKTSTTGGTLFYMSPEQTKSLANVDLRTDIYSIGMTFYEMLAGRIPFEKTESSFTIQKAIVEQKFPPPQQFNQRVPVKLGKLIMKAIKKDPEKRFQNANEMLESISQFEGQVQKTETMIVNPLQPKRSKKTFAFMAIIVGLAAVLLVVFALRENLLSPLQTFPEPIDVGSKPRPALTDPVVTGPANLILRVLPYGSITVNGNLEAENTEGPVQVALNSGTNKILFQHPVYGDNEIELQLNGGETKEVTFYFESYVNVDAYDNQGNPIRGELVINNRKTGVNTPASRHPLRPGKNEITVFKSGYQTIQNRQVIEVKPTAEERVYQLVFGLKKL